MVRVRLDSTDHDAASGAVGERVAVDGDVRGAESDAGGDGDGVVADPQADLTEVVTRVTGTFAGELRLPDGCVIPPTGRSFDLEFTQTVKWEGERIVEIAAFCDTAEQARQIGLAGSGR